ncbi:MAG: BMP family ABC transporter substrate-binding protein [Lachnospiraceae bacterium]|nr:BMP family ABC transporter substrate-binding protein [Lachnospiraceae bacterium]
MSEEYAQARKAGNRAYMKAISAGRYPYLPALEDIVKDQKTAGEKRLGMMEIPIDMIAGCCERGRNEAFADNYMPILDEQSEFAVKWGRLYQAQQDEGFREPIQAYEYMQKFYVREGNKRVSIMKYLGSPVIAAEVTRMLPRKEKDKNIAVYYEFLEFYQAAPIYEITFSEEGSYRALAKALGKTLDKPWEPGEVACVASAFARFSEIFEERGGKRLRITAGDAFLLYLQVYSLDSLLYKEKAALKQRIQGIWRELVLKENTDSRQFLKSLEALEKNDGLLSRLMGGSAYTEKHPLKMAFLYDGNPEFSGWNYGHELGRKYLDSRFEGILKTCAFADCRDRERTDEAIETAIRDQNQVILTTSGAQMEAALRAAVRNPKVKFLNCSMKLAHTSVRSYYARMYEAKFLMGMLAASHADNHRIGYVIEEGRYEANANINAFAIGAAMIDPQVRVTLLPDAEETIPDAFAKGIHILSAADRIKPSRASREYGVLWLEGPEKPVNLAAPVIDWGKYYELLANSILNRKWEAKELTGSKLSLLYWWGMAEGVVDVLLSERLPYHSKKMIAIMKKAVVSGALNPFAGELRSQGGEIRHKEEEMLSDREIVEMDWLNDNVAGDFGSGM